MGTNLVGYNQDALNILDREQTQEGLSGYVRRQ